MITYNTQNTIFSNSIPAEIQWLIIDATENDALVPLSQVSKCAQTTLQNGGIFKARCMELYSDRLFQNFQKHYPNCCWKMICSLDLKKPPITAFKKDFLNQAATIPGILEDVEEEIEMREGELKCLNGEYYEDPHSQIHSAYIQGQHEHCKSLQYAAEVTQNRLNYLRYKLENPENTILGGLLVDQYFIHYQESLKSERIKIRATIADLNLYELSTLNVFIDRRFPKTASIFFEIIYHQCANRVTEDDWGKNHWHEFLPDFENIFVEFDRYLDIQG